MTKKRAGSAPASAKPGSARAVSTKAAPAVAPPGGEGKPEPGDVFRTFVRALERLDPTHGPAKRPRGDKLP